MTALTYSDALRIARGCRDYVCGYSGAELAVFRAGINAVVDALERANDDLDTLTARGAAAWAGVPDATAWVDELRGSDSEGGDK